MNYPAEIVPYSPSSVKDFNKVTIQGDCTALRGHHQNELFFDCEFDKLNSLVLEKCDLNRSKFTTSSIRDAVGFTTTLDCHHFNNVEYSELLFDLLLYLMTTTKGNDEKREQIKSMLGTRHSAFKKLLEGIE